MSFKLRNWDNSSFLPAAVILFMLMWDIFTCFSLRGPGFGSMPPISSKVFMFCFAFRRDHCLCEMLMTRYELEWGWCVFSGLQVDLQFCTGIRMLRMSVRLPATRDAGLKPRGSSVAVVRSGGGSRSILPGSDDTERWKVKEMLSREPAATATQNKSVNYQAATADDTQTSNKWTEEISAYTHQRNKN